MKRILLFLSIFCLFYSAVSIGTVKECQDLATKAKTFKAKYKALDCEAVSGGAQKACLAKQKQLKQQYLVARKAYSECALSHSNKAT